MEKALIKQKMNVWRHTEERKDLSILGSHQTIIKFKQTGSCTLLCTAVNMLQNVTTVIRARQYIKFNWLFIIQSW